MFDMRPTKQPII